MENPTQKIRPTLYGMAVGDIVKFPITRLKSVRPQASELSIKYERKYTTRTDRVEKTIVVKRIA